jgi:Mrp family chromosome partitioning ATPase
MKVGGPFMGRTLETLRQAEPPRTARVDGPAAPPSSAPEECVVDWTLQEEVPFIEVGATGKDVELSPLLVKHPPQGKVQPPHPALGKSLAGAKGGAAVNLTDARPMAVVFEPWPGPAAAGAVSPEIVAHHQPEHPVSREYATLFTKMREGLQGAGPLALLLSGVKPRVGTSTVLLNLAAVAARSGQRVVALDANLARPALAPRLGYRPAAGLQDVVAGSVALEQAVLSTPVSGLHLLPAGGKKTGPLTTEAITWLVAWLRERFEMVLIDGPCVEDAADLVLFAPHADGLYLVLPQGETGPAGKGAAQSLTRMGGHLRGLIHTHFGES